MLKSAKILLLGYFILSAQPALAATIPAADLIGKYAFDWLKPEKAKCAALTDKNLASVTSCSYNKDGDTGSFSGKADYYVCKVSKNSELIVYKTQARCAEELEIMKSNGP
jgi:hypothetical protein